MFWLCMSFFLWLQASRDKLTFGGKKNRWEFPTLFHNYFEMGGNRCNDAYSTVAMGYWCGPLDDRRDNSFAAYQTFRSLSKFEWDWIMSVQVLGARLSLQPVRPTMFPSRRNSTFGDSPTLSNWISASLRRSKRSSREMQYILSKKSQYPVKVFGSI